MIQGLSLHFETRDDAQQCLRVLKKSGSSAKLSVDTTLHSQEMVQGRIRDLRAFHAELQAGADEEAEALELAREIIALEESAFSRIMNAIEEDGGSYLARAYEERETLSEEELASLTEDAYRVIVYEKEGLIEESDGTLRRIRELDPGDHSISIPSPLLLFPDPEALKAAHLTGERVVSSETVYSVQAGSDVIFCHDPTDLIDAIQECRPEEESFVTFLEQFFLLLTLADELARLIQNGCLAVADLVRELPAAPVSLDADAYPLRFDVAPLMIEQMVDILRSSGRISGKDGRLRIR